MAMWHTAELTPGVRLHCMQTERFHSGYFSVELMRPLEAVNASRNAVLMNVLRRGTRTCPDMTRIEERLNELYGASVDPCLSQLGEIITIGLQAVFPDDRYLPGETRYLEKVLSFCGEMLLDPATRGGLLNDEFVRSERQNLHDQLEAAVNDKRKYARKRLRKLMFDGEAYGVYPMGEAEDALKVHYQQLTKYYKSMLRVVPIEVYYCGSAEAVRVEAAVREALLTLPSTNRLPQPEAAEHPYPNAYRSVTEEMDVKQGNLAIGFRMTPGGHTDQAALLVFNELFGGGASSRLFRSVREEKSLCYSIGSSVDRFKEIMTVSAGIGFDKREEAEEAIYKELEALQHGEFTPEELETAKRGVAGALKNGLDKQSAICGFNLAQEMLGEVGDLAHFAALSMVVQPEDVQAIAQRMKPELSYFLRKGEQA